MDGLHRPFTNITGAAGTTTWYSFLGQRLGETSANVPGNLYPRGANMGLFNREGTTPERVAVGNSSNATTDEWSIIPEGSGTLREGSPLTSPDWSAGAWGVLRIDHVGDATVPDNAYLWINPNPLGGEPLIANADVTILSADTNARDFSDVDFVRPFVGQTQGTVGMANHRPFAIMEIDEIRLGTTWDDMRNTAGIPEPTSCVMLVLGGLAICARRNKR